MRCISLWQPWASFCFWEALDGSGIIKKHETRGWSTSYRGAMVIHAAKRKPTRDELSYYEEIFLEAGKSEIDLPLGSVVGVVDLVGVHRVEDIRDQLGWMDEYTGNYEDGRFAWEFGRVIKFETPIPFKGAQGFFNVPDDLIRNAIKRPAEVLAEVSK